tara:strand:+ start:1390 stop:3153 length:1764 start_codon:yes stop_codon:yes gene_type:complete
MKIRLAFLLILLPLFYVSGEDISGDVLQEIIDNQEIPRKDVDSLDPLSSTLVNKCETENVSIFGHQFFCNTPTSITPVGDLPVPSSYVISLRDEIEILYLNDSKNRSFIRPVRLDGNILLPEVGLIRLEGKTLESAEKEINKRILETHVGIKASISIQKLSAKKILVIGAVKKPGAYLVNPFTTISNSLSYAGGLEPYASIRDIKLVKPSGESYTFDSYDLLINGDRTNDLTIGSGDTIVVKATSNLIAIRGSVFRPMSYEYLEQETIRDLINYSLGLTRRANTKAILIESINLNSSKLDSNILPLSNIETLEGISSITIFDSTQSEVALKQGGLIKTYETSEMLTLKVEGEINNPGIYRFSPGISLNEVYARAGGITKNADKKTTILLRDSIKEKQIKDLRQSKRKLREEIISNSVRKGVEVSEELLAFIDMEIDESLLGRISGDFYPESEDSKAMILQNGDSIFIPKTPKTISVIGEVATPSTFIYKGQNGYEDYIEMAGGIKPSASKRNIYIIKANGLSVRARNSRSIQSWIPKSSNKIEAGDTIVVPLKVSRDTNRVELVTELTGIISNIAFAAASLQTLKNN